MDAENSEWKEPSNPDKIKAEDAPPQMTEVETLGNIFFEPGRTFEDLKRKPRFVLATLILAILATAYGFGLYYKVGDEGFRRFAVEQVDKSPQAANATAEQKEGSVKLQMTIGKVVRYAMPILVIIFTAFLSLFYWLGAKAFGGNGNYLHAVSVWVYSSLPPAVIGLIANLIVLIFKSVDEIDIAASQRGVINANLGFLVDGKSMPVIATLLSVIDLFAIWGWILASIGLQKTNKISSGSAWAITIILALIGISLRVVGAIFSGNPG